MSASPLESWLGSYFSVSGTANGNATGPADGGPPLRIHHTRRSQTEDEPTADSPNLTLDDQALIAAIAAGDIDRFTQWYSELYTDACRFAYRFFDDRDQAADVVQDVFLSIWERRDRWRISIAPRTYVLSAIRRRALHVLRHDRVVEKHTGAHTIRGDDSEIPGHGAPQQLPDARIAEDRLESIMRQAIADLPERQRTALTLRWEYGMTNAEIAHTLGVGEAAVSRVMARAMEALRGVWERVTAGEGG